MARRQCIVGTGVLLAFCVLAGRASCFEPVWDSVFRLTVNPADQYTGYGRQRSVAAGGNGDVHVAWNDQRTVPYRLWYRRFDQAQQAWLPETSLTSRPVNCNRPGIACSSTGDIHLVWHTEQYPYYGIWYKRYDAATRMWRPDTLIDSGTSTRLRLYPSVSCRPGGDRVHVAWYGHPDTGTYYQVFHKEYRPDSGWGATAVITDAPCFHDQVSVAADRDNNLCVTWCGLDFGGNFNQAFCRRRVGGAWQQVELVSDFALSLSQYAPCAAADGSGGFHVVWHGRSGGDVYQNVYHRLRRPDGWSDIVTLTTQTMRLQEYPGISCLDNGECHAVWRGQSAGSAVCQLYHAARGRTGVWSQPARLTGRTQDVCHPSIAGFADSIVHVVWHDFGSGDMDVYYLRGRLEGTGLQQRELPPAAGPVLSVAPNPVAGGFAGIRIQGFEDSRNQVARLRVCDAAGRCVLIRSFDIGTAPGAARHSSFAIPLDCRSLSSGVYLIEVEYAGSAARTRLVVPGR